jgi:hypothetical protein
MLPTVSGVSIPVLSGSIWHAAGGPIAAPSPQLHGHIHLHHLHPCLGRIGDILCPGLLKNFFGVSSLCTIVLYGNENVALLNFALVALSFIFRNA